MAELPFITQTCQTVMFHRFDREGYDLEYDVTEKGYAQFLCKIDLPVDSPSGVSTTAEALVKGTLCSLYGVQFFKLNKVCKLDTI